MQFDNHITSGMSRINIGCGQTPTKGWRNFDNSLSLKLAKWPLLFRILVGARMISPSQERFIRFARSNLIEYGEATNRLPVETGSIDVLYSSHMFEHLDRQEAVLFLSEAKRVLRSGGILRLAVPDLQKELANYISHRDADQLMISLHLSQPKPRTAREKLTRFLVGDRHHQWMYDALSLCTLLEKHGFMNAVALEAGESTIPNPGELNLRERDAESLYVEAVKP